MMKRVYLLLSVAVLFVTVFLTSCNHDSEPNPQFMPTSSGIADEVLIVSDKEVWDDSLSKAVEYLLMYPYPVLPQYEPTISYTYVNFKDFTGMFRRHRNVVFLADLSKNSALSDFVVQNLGEDKTAEALNDPDFFYGLRRDVWAKPQVLYFVFANGEEALLNKIKQRGNELVTLVLENELKNKYTKTHDPEGHNYEAEKRLKERYGISLFVPETFFIAYDQDGVMWLRRETDDASHNLFVKVFPKDSLNLGNLYSIIQARDELGKIVETDVDTAYMESDEVLNYQYREVRVNGMDAVEVRGLWKMKYDFMGGPFINYAVEDHTNNRVIMLDAWVYAPKTKKKPEIRRIEAMVSTLKLTGEVGVQ